MLEDGRFTYRDLNMTDSDSRSPRTDLRSPVTICDTPSADLTIHTSDGIDFHVHKTILSMTSVVFRDMLALINSEDEVNLTEDSRTIDNLLRFCYPLEDPILNDLGELWNVRKAANKYMMDFVEQRVSTLLESDFAPKEPLRMYALACRDGNEKEAREAARWLLRQPMFAPYVPDLEGISAGTLYRLFEYRKKCGEVVSTLKFEWMSRTDYVFLRPTSEHTGSCEEMDSAMLIVNGRVHIARTWWKDYANRARKALKERPYGGVVKDAEYVWPALISAATCKRCRNEAYSDLMEFADMFAVEVDKATVKVAQEMKFINP